MFDKGAVKEAFTFFESHIAQLSEASQATDLATPAEEEGTKCLSATRVKLLKIRLLYAKLLLKAGLLVECRE